MKNKLPGTSCWLLILLFFTGNDITAQILSVPQKNQEQTQWCWCATSQAVLEYYGVIKTQTEIAQYGTDGANNWNWLYGSSSSPTQNGVDLILSHFGSIQSTGIANWFTLASIDSELIHKRPLPIRWGWDSGGGHILIIIGASDTLIYLMDPWYGPTINSYSWVRQGSSHTWTHSLKINTIPTNSIGRTDRPIYGYALFQNFPNPFNPSTTISFSLPSKSFVSLKVYDILGREIATIYSGEMLEGNYTQQWDGSSMPSGIYFCRLQARSTSGELTFTETKKLILSK